jgi:hypothetical protein
MTTATALASRVPNTPSAPRVTRADFLKQFGDIRPDRVV